MKRFRFLLIALVLVMFTFASAPLAPASPNSFPMPAAGSPVQAPYSFPCHGGAHYSGSLSFTGDFDYQPNGTLYYSSTTGHHKGCLYGPSGADFDLYLLKWIDSAWVIVARAEGGSSTAFISYFGLPGAYRWKVYSYNGSGNYDFWRIWP